MIDNQQDQPSNNTIATLPEGYRPIVDTIFPLLIAGNSVALNAVIRTNGIITMGNNGLTADLWYCGTAVFFTK